MLGLEAERATQVLWREQWYPPRTAEEAHLSEELEDRQGFHQTQNSEKRGQIHFSDNAAPQGLKKDASRAEAEHTVGGLELSLN